MERLIHTLLSLSTATINDILGCIFLDRTDQFLSMGLQWCLEKNKSLSEYVATLPSEVAHTKPGLVACDIVHVPPVVVEEGHRPPLPQHQALLRVALPGDVLHLLVSDPHLVELLPHVLHCYFDIMTSQDLIYYLLYVLNVSHLLQQLIYCLLNDLLLDVGFISLCNQL